VPERAGAAYEDSGAELVVRGLFGGVATAAVSPPHGGRAREDEGVAVRVVKALLEDGFGPGLGLVIERQGFLVAIPELGDPARDDGARPVGSVVIRAPVKKNSISWAATWSTCEARRSGTSSAIARGERPRGAVAAFEWWTRVRVGIVWTLSKALAASIVCSEVARGFGDETASARGMAVLR
jgi:hypothetical protein